MADRWCHGMHYGLTSLCGEAEVDWFGEPGLEHSISPPAFSTTRLKIYTGQSCYWSLQL